MGFLLGIIIGWFMFTPLEVEVTVKEPTPCVERIPEPPRLISVTTSEGGTTTYTYIASTTSPYNCK